MSCRLDYCNSLLAGVADVHLRRLQLVQNDAACLVCGARPHDHITPILATLHWLPVCQRVIFKPAVLVWKCLHARRSATLPVRPLCAGGVYGRSSPVSLCCLRGPLVPWTRTSTSQCSFAAFGPRTWNRLPTALRSPELSLVFSSACSRPTCSSTGQCWLQLWVSCTVVRRRCDCTASSSPTTNVQTRLNFHMAHYRANAVGLLLLL